MFHTVPTLPEFELVTDQPLRWTEEKVYEHFEGHCGCIRDDGRTKTFDHYDEPKFTLTLDTDLCGGCEHPLDNGVCDDCQLVYVERISPTQVAA